MINFIKNLFVKKPVAQKKDWFKAHFGMTVEEAHAWKYVEGKSKLGKNIITIKLNKR